MIFNKALEEFKRDLEAQALERLRQTTKYVAFRDLKIDLTRRVIHMYDHAGRVLIRYSITENGKITNYDGRRGF